MDFASTFKGRTVKHLASSCVGFVDIHATIFFFLLRFAVNSAKADRSNFSLLKCRFSRFRCGTPGSFVTARNKLDDMVVRIDSPMFDRGISAAMTDIKSRGRMIAGRAKQSNK